jgi:hypothetical protein
MAKPCRIEVGRTYNCRADIHKWTEDGTLRYFGEGKRGITLTGRNRANAHHAADSKELLLFEGLGALYRLTRSPVNRHDFTKSPDPRSDSRASKRARIGH